MPGIPDELVQQFRTIALERLDRVETAWASVLASFDDGAAVQAHRELHTLKGESKMLGFSDVNLVCHKLEDMLEVARARGYAVNEDFDLAVNMAIRFMAMLVRKKVGAHLSGIDLPGFIRQIDSILGELRPDTKQRVSTGTIPPIKAVTGGARVPVAVRSRLAPIAVDAYVEYATARGARRDRLRSSWHGLRDLIGIHRAVVGPGQLAKHKAGAQSLARELGKQIDVVLEIGSSEATAEVLSAIDTAILHLVRNAVDHGIERPEERTAAGKPPQGTIRVQSGVVDDRLVATVMDDGRGVSLDEVRARAIDLGLIAPTDTDIEDRWFDLICQPGFSTRAHASEISGRGIGLDAVRVGILEVGGALTATTTKGRGTCWNIVVALPKISFDAQVVRVPSVPFPVMVEASWQQVDPAAGVPVIDLAHRLGLTEEPSMAAPCYFARDGKTVGIIAERPRQTTIARRLVVTPPPTPYEIVILDSIEGVLVHLDRMR